MLRVSMSFIGFTAVVFPLFGAVFAIVWSILYDYEASVRTACRVRVYLQYKQTDKYKLYLSRAQISLNILSP